MNVKQLNVESVQSSLTCIVCFNQSVAKIWKILRNHISSNKCKLINSLGVQQFLIPENDIFKTKLGQMYQILES